MNLRVSLYGGPGCGKSTLASLVFAKLKLMHCSVELVNEYIKSWAYEKRQLQSFDQVYIFAKQQRLEDRVLRAGVELIVSDSPLFLQCFYAKRYNHSCWPELFSIARKFDDQYPSLNILLHRHDGEYQQGGRYETHKQALEIDTMLRQFLEEQNIPYFECDNDADDVVLMVLHKLKEMGRSVAKAKKRKKC